MIAFEINYAVGGDDRCADGSSDVLKVDVNISPEAKLRETVEDDRKRFASRFDIVVD